MKWECKKCGKKGKYLKEIKKKTFYSLFNRKVLLYVCPECKIPINFVRTKLN